MTRPHRTGPRKVADQLKRMYFARGVDVERGNTGVSIEPGQCDDASCFLGQRRREASCRSSGEGKEWLDLWGCQGGSPLRGAA